MSEHFAENDAPPCGHDGCGWCVVHDCAATACAHEHPRPARPIPPEGRPLSLNACDEKENTMPTETDEAVTPRYTSALEMSRKAEQAERRAEEAEFHVEQLRDARDSAERRAEDAEAAIEATRDLLAGWEHDGPDDYAVRLLIQRVREMLALRQRFEDGRAARPLPLHRTEAGYPNCSTCDGGGCLDCTDPA